MVAQYGSTHPKVAQVIQERMYIAERTGERGDARKAASRYQALADELRASLGPFDGRVLDAYEGVARWVANGYGSRLTGEQA
ncbi:hypothetical protein ACFV42_23375 [Streptomyces solisilvae]|uniref:hypothetical protein n=1 Tax=Streptomyces malaysiensis TaxID=92644 RepID=UPI00367B2BC9